MMVVDGQYGEGHGGVDGDDLDENGDGDGDEQKSGNWG